MQSPAKCVGLVCAIQIITLRTEYNVYAYEILKCDLFSNAKQNIFMRHLCRIYKYLYILHLF